MRDDRLLQRLPLIAMLTLVAALGWGCRVGNAGAHREVLIAGAATPPDREADLAVDVQNHRGSVRVYVDPRYKQPRVRALRVPPGGVRPDRDRRAAPDPGPQAGWAAAELLVIEGRGTLRVLAEQPFEDYADWATLIEIRLPRCNGVRVRNSGGLVELVNVQGAIDVDNGPPGTAGGSIALRTRHTIVDPLALHTPQGDITVRVGPNSAFALDASTRSGRVDVVARGYTATDALIERFSWAGKVNSGESPAVLTTGSGNVTVELDRPPPPPKPVKKKKKKRGE
jgi:hypothetical protein